ncbi:cell wall protein [Diaporthe eres]|uniref:Cell wall protein n=1 Tax=Diaporthe vaccinii TaxID=105482 RepID=A0ABR4ERM7_9PEZI|nr:cell wall protein [Diaporthe eres]
MKFLSILTLTGATSVMAAPVEIERRQVDAIKGALAPVMTSLKDLDTAINGLTTDPQTAAPILTSSQAASKALSGAATKIQAADDLGLFGSLGLQQTGTDLATQVTTTIGDLTAKKPVLDMLGVTPVALQALQQQKQDSGGLSDALLSKVPALARPIAAQSTDMISKALDDGIAALSAGGTAATPAAGAAGAKPAGGAAPATGAGAAKPAGSAAPAAGAGAAKPAGGAAPAAGAGGAGATTGGGKAGDDDDDDN